MNSQVSTERPGAGGVGGIILAGIVAGVIIAPVATYFGIDYFGQIGPACGGGGEEMTCFMRQIVMSGMAIPVGAIIGFGIAYGVAVKKFNKGR